MTESVPLAVPYGAVSDAVVVLRYLHRPRLLHQILLFQRTLLISTAVFLLLLCGGYIVFPADPTIQISRITPNRIKINTSPALTIDLSFSLDTRVRNPNFFSLDYDFLVVSLEYRGRELGLVKSKGGKMKARGVSHINATLELSSFQVIQDAFYLIQDFTRGIIPFETVTTIQGHVGIPLLRFPIKSKVECEVYVNVNEQTIGHENSYPDFSLPNRFELNAQ